MQLGYYVHTFLLYTEQEIGLKTGAKVVFVGTLKIKSVLEIIVSVSMKEILMYVSAPRTLLPLTTLIFFIGTPYRGGMLVILATACST